jgi:hypothetical protein
MERDMYFQLSKPFWRKTRKERGQDYLSGLRYLNKIMIIELRMEEVY